MSVEQVVQPRNRPAAESCSHATIGDLRFRALLPAAQWESLNPCVRRRFSKRLADGATVVYVGETREIWISPAGWFLAQAARLVGGPLPTSRDTHVPTFVTVTEDMRTGGQIWTRLYARRSGFPQVIHSSKRFAGPTGLEEYVGFGICMALTIHAEGPTLAFRSAGYCLHAFGSRLKLPQWASPGALTVTHTDNGDGSFVFSLELVHRRFGVLIRQSAVYREASHDLRSALDPRSPAARAQHGTERPKYSGHKRRELSAP
jgi:hypothetical protein